MTETTPIERLQEHSLSDDKARQIANHTQPSWAGPYGSTVVPVRDTGDGIKVGSPTTTQGGERIQWSDSVIMTFGAAGKSLAAVRDSYQTAKSRRIADSRRQHR